MVEAQENVAIDYAQPTMTEQELSEKALQWSKKSFFHSLFPVLPIERPQFWCMFGIFVTCAFAYSFLRLFKDRGVDLVLVPSAANWLKIFTFISSLISVGIVQKLLAKWKIDRVFGLFSIFFAVLLFVFGCLLKFRDDIQFRDMWIQEEFVGGILDIRGFGFCYTLGLIVNHWVISVFYVVCELMGSIMLSFLSLTYFNSHLTSNQNARFVRVLYLGSNFITLAASLAYKGWTTHIKGETYEYIDKYYLIFPVFIGILFLFIYVLKRTLDNIFFRPIVSLSSVGGKAKSKKSVSIMTGLYTAFTSRLLLAISASALFCNVTQMLLLSVTKNAQAACEQLQKKPKGSISQDFKSYDMFGGSAVVVLIMVSPVSQLATKIGFYWAALIPLMANLIGGLVSNILAMINYPKLGEENMSIVGRIFDGIALPEELEIWANLIFGILSKATKYGVFDITKELISMQLHPQDRPLFKGVSDGVVGKLGKCTGSIYNIVMEAITGRRDPRYYAPVTLFALLVMFYLWDMANKYLSRKYEEVKDKNQYLSPDYFEFAKVK